MDRMLYVAMTGASQTMLAQAANNHNLANASTTGFRADLSAFRAMPVFGPGAPSRVYAMAERPGTDFSYGTVLSTGRDLDVAVKGEGWIAVQGPDGKEGYTRAGDLRISSSGQLENGAGHPVLGNSGPIAIPPAEKVEIAADGTVSIQPTGQSAATLAVVDRIKLVKPPLEDLMKDSDGLMRTKDGSAVAADAAVGVAAGSLESSNVNPVDAMVNMISLARQFEMQVKMMRASQENDASAAQILRMG
jgi:flagellar basal-body rod protein FlgF